MLPCKTRGISIHKSIIHNIVRFDNKMQTITESLKIELSIFLEKLCLFFRKARVIMCLTGSRRDTHMFNKNIVMKILFVYCALKDQRSSGERAN